MPSAEVTAECGCENGREVLDAVNVCEGEMNGDNARTQ
jgi:hypothetical protein